LRRSLRQLLNLGFENLEMGFWVEGFSSGVLDKFGGGIATAVGVDFLTKPAEEGLVVAIFHRGGEGRNIPIRSLPKLGRGQIAESICGKVTKAAKGPVDVLEATACIVGDF
jgi:hypothetical protein